MKGLRIDANSDARGASSRRRGYPGAVPISVAGWSQSQQPVAVGERRDYEHQRQAMLARLPEWVTTDRYAIEARAEGNPTKDQMRLMVQSLLAERFLFAAHFESRVFSALALALVKPGKAGPRLRAALRRCPLRIHAGYKTTRSPPMAVVSTALSRGDYHQRRPSVQRP